MISRIKKAIKILINHDKKKVVSENDLLQYNRVQPWFAAKGDQTLRLDYDLNSDSIVFDIGGYKGEFAAEILCKYNANIYIFEPIREFFLIIKNKFSNNIKVKPFNFGLAGKEQELEISLSDNSSSVYLNGENKETILIKSIVDFIKTNNVKQIDLIKINIEGGEYELLESLIDNGCISIFKNIQIQFHDFLFENAKERMNKIQENLSKTHELTYQYEFVWENWKIK
ncbi:FkbM family methyltransferase [Flavobacterium sp. ZT3R18]|uniref:FkbM family methyltransferase n=1 Tax=Flavobacterium sp. ZT3R18 TaxID=2594429 RepID=UPI001179CD50|nr:FkbM family methyltransferase [Flavobacterium sp. ZT3R18]TRX34831.1 FkbM family methyltransferase [Flavobacterium sp. ZT3R18]